MSFMTNFAQACAVGLGAALGAWGRWGLGIAFNATLPNLPLGTLLVNLSGGVAMGVVLGVVGLGGWENQSLRLFITTGFLGGLTTFSAFTGESLSLLQRQEYGWAIIHASAHVLGALLMAAVGYWIVQCLRA